MPNLNRRNVLKTGMAFAIPPGLVALVTGCSQSEADKTQQAESNETSKSKNETSKPKTDKSKPAEGGKPMKIQYLEIVTPEVDGLVKQYSDIYDITFGEPEPNFGGARTAKLEGGGMIGIRGPMRETENPVVRPYVLVDDIKAAVEAAEKAGAKVAMPPMKIPEHGMFAIVIHGGIDCGFWQN